MCVCAHRKSYMRCGIGWQSNLLLRSSMDDIDVGLSAEPSYHCRLSLSLKADAFALQTIGSWQHGKILMWAWLSRGYVSDTQLAKWRFKGDLPGFRDAMVKIRGALKQFLHLDTLPEVDVESKKVPWEQAADPQAGEARHAWVVETTNSLNQIEEKALPQYFNIGIDTAISVWVAEADKWTTMINARMAVGMDLAPKQAKLYTAWQENPVRRHLLLYIYIYYYYYIPLLLLTQIILSTIWLYV